MLGFQLFKPKKELCRFAGMEVNVEFLRYPVGTFSSPEDISDELLDRWIETIEYFPRKLENLMSKFTNAQLDTPYRSGGWTVRQVVHHVGDSHLNSYIRFKWTLTEDSPVIKAYYEDRWADLIDYQTVPIGVSLQFLNVLHAKWVYLLRGMTKDQLDRCFIHPESGEEISLRKNIGLYAWHCQHHYAHISNLSDRMGW